MYQYFVRVNKNIYRIDNSLFNFKRVIILKKIILISKKMTRARSLEFWKLNWYFFMYQHFDVVLFSYSPQLFTPKVNTEFSIRGTISSLNQDCSTCRFMCMILLQTCDFSVFYFLPMFQQFLHFHVEYHRIKYPRVLKEAVIKILGSWNIPN